jgi:lipoate-protein ligase A
LRFNNEKSRQRAKERIRARAASVSELMGRQISWEEAAQALVEGFEHALGWKLTPSELSETELKRAAELESNSYADPGWTQRV